PGAETSVRFLSLIPKSSTSLLSTLQSQNRGLRLKLLESEHRLSQVHSRRREDSKANARVVEIFASHRHCWQEEEKCLLRQIDSGEEEITRLRAMVEELEKSEAEMRQNVEELRRVNEGRNHEMLNFMAARSGFEEFSDCGGGGECCSESARFGEVRVLEKCFLEREMKWVICMDGAMGLVLSF
ncbi:uncharacterized protein LOC114286408, partial [Camellia sinensis]|uniref:uncharacterized protein LOC114286408 n=1 Tax=Camellia sinensis TaxID=4442 RepID=UPI00103577AA